MEIKVLAFGQIAELIGTSVIIRDVSDTNSLIKQLQLEYPGILSLTYKMAVNKKLVSANITLDESMTVALLPPFSGG